MDLAFPVQEVNVCVVPTMLYDNGEPSQTWWFNDYDIERIKALHHPSILIATNEHIILRFQSVVNISVSLREMEHILRNVLTGDRKILLGEANVGDLVQTTLAGVPKGGVYKVLERLPDGLIKVAKQLPPSERPTNFVGPHQVQKLPHDLSCRVINPQYFLAY